MRAITAEQLRAISPGLRAPDHDAAAFFPYLPAAVSEYGIGKTLERFAAFLAQVLHETQGLTRLEESFAYKPDRLAAIMPRRFVDAQAAAHFIALGPSAVAERMYGGRMGNRAVGDGWKFRGRGAPMLTGFDNYRLFGDRLRLDLVGSPDLAKSPEHTFRIAGDFWKKNGCEAQADAGNPDGVGRLWNVGNLGAPAIGARERELWRVRVLEVMQRPAA